MQTMHLRGRRKPNIEPPFPSPFVQPAKWIHRRRRRRHCSCGWRKSEPHANDKSRPETRPIDIVGTQGL